MSSVPDTPPPPPSVFISYASADRAAARLLGETLTKAGLDVWLDEEELAGGDAWDAKIRKQIRTCTYFMPVISATTEARHEGYFRREWRFAVERTLDLADDVLFLTPVVIDGTHDQGARVPEKFTSVQWLRCPGGRETPQLVALARRLAAGHTIASAPASAPPMLPRGPQSRREARAERGSRQGPLPPFPAFPEFPPFGQRGRFAYNLVVWAGHTIVALWARLPKWLRLIATVYIVFSVISWVFSHRESEPKPRRSTEDRVVVPKKLAQSFTTTGSKEADDALRKVSDVVNAVAGAVQSGRPLAVVTFAPVTDQLKEPADSAFDGLYDQLINSGHDHDVALSPVPLPADADEAAIYARAAPLKCHWILVGSVKPAYGDECTLTVRLYDVVAKKRIWYAERSGDTDTTKSFGEELARELLKHVSFDAAAPEPPPPAPLAPADTK